MNTGFPAIFATTIAVSATAAAAQYAGVPQSEMRQPTVAPNIPGTLAIPIRAERFVTNVTRAREDDSRNPGLQRLIAPARGMAKPKQLTFVQKAVQDQISWMSDATLWGQHDYWASASQTLARGAGDMEDRAILKMQALIALGFNRKDLFITLARDRVDGPVVVLTARLGNHYYILNDTGGRPFDSEERHFELRPTISFGMTGAWLHTKPPSPTVVSALAGK